MRRLSKNRRKTSESKNEVKKNGESSEACAVASEPKTRKSRSNNDMETSSTPRKRVKHEDYDPLCKEAEMVVDSRVNRKKLQYKVRWRNYSADEDTWESPEDLDPQLIEDFENEKEGSTKPVEKVLEKTPKPRKSLQASQPAEEAPRKSTKPNIEPETENEVESILAVRIVNNKRRYKVHWKGLSSEEDSWISENKLKCPELLQDFFRKQKEKRNLPKPINEDEDSAEYEVEKVVEVKFRKGGAREFLIRWKGFTSKDDTWEPEDNLNCPDLIDKFMAKVEKAKSSTSRELRANPIVTDRLTLNMKSSTLRYSRRPQTQNRPTYHSFLE